jgi:hypothetical protein
MDPDDTDQFGFHCQLGGELHGCPEVVQAAEKWGLRDRLILIGVGELVSALLFLIPPTNSLGGFTTVGLTGAGPSSHTCKTPNLITTRLCCCC